MLYYRYIFIIFLPLFFLASCTKSVPPSASDIILSSDPVSTNTPNVETLEKNEDLQEIDNAGSWNIDSTSKPASKQRIYGKKDFPLIVTPQVELYLQKFQSKQNRQMKRWFERSGKYIGMIREELAKKGLPPELVYLAMVESAYMPDARSYASAVGLWQFMKGTGRQYGLKINRNVDERKNALKSTIAATAYLSDLYDRFDDWHLAVAAYNAGPGKVNHGLTKYKVDNFWDLAQTKHLRIETKSYVPKLIATILLAKDPTKYGFQEFNLAKPYEFDTLTVGPGLPFDAIAKISGSSSKTIKKLNLELIQKRTPPNVKDYEIKIPKGSYKLAATNLSRLHSFVSTGYKIHIYRKGERISKICRKYNINQSTLFNVNNIKGKTIPINARLKIPYSTVVYKLLPKGNNGTFVAGKNDLILHKIKRGESVNSIAKKYSVPTSMIISWNNLRNAAKIREGQQLALFINRNAGKLQAEKKNLLLAVENKKIFIKNGQNVNNIKEKIVLVAENKKILLGNNADKITWYLVRNGDSLWTISRKFKISPNSIKRENNLNSNLIHPGSKLKIVKS